MLQKRLTLSILASTLILSSAPLDSNTTTPSKLTEAENEPEAVDLGDVEFSDREIKRKPKVTVKKRKKSPKVKRAEPKVVKREIKSYSPAKSIKKESLKEVAESQNIDTQQTQEKTQDEDSIKLENISKIEVKSADVAEAIAKNSPSVSLVRRSGIANDLIVRGLKKDNISILIDGTKIYGACPNRMDPPLSHVLANNIDYIEVKEGNDVTAQGAMGASIKVHTLEPTKEFKGDMNVGVGRWGYRKLSTSLGGGLGDFRFWIGLSTESANQYQDGAGDDFAHQQDRYIANNPKAGGLAYKPDLRDMKAYTKSTMMGKIFWDITQNQTLKFSYTANRSKDILYPNTPMDADYDNSDLYNVDYEIRDLGEFSKKLNLQYYHTEVDHPMSNRNRKSSIKMGVVTHHLTTEVDGGKISNQFDYCNHSVELGADYSKRKWDGLYYKNGKLFPEAKMHSIWSVETEDRGLYIKDKFQAGDFIWDLGLRYDSFEITTPRVGDRDREFNELTGNLMLTYILNQSTKIFAGVGSGYRVPDGKELYYRNKMGIAIGDDDLDGVRSYEFDAGVKYSCGDVALQLKGFYNYLKDDILYNSTGQNIGGKVYGKYENVDAYIYGLEFSGGYRLSDKLITDFSLAWIEGKKESPLTGQSDKDLPEIPPLRATFGVDYMPSDTLTFRTEFQASSRWNKIDSDNGEQAIAGWGVVNLKLKKSWGEHFEITAGVDNLFDQKYRVSNSYKDLTLITGGDEVMLLNEPGRYTYINFRYKF